MNTILNDFLNNFNSEDKKIYSEIATMHMN